MNLFKKSRPYPKIPEAERMAIIERSCKQVSRGVFFSTIIIVASFLPVFLLDRAGRKIVSSAGLHQDFYPDRGCISCDHPGTGPDFIFYEGQIPSGIRQSHKQFSRKNI